MKVAKVQNYITIDLTGDESHENDEYHDIMAVSDERIKSAGTTDFQNYLKSNDNDVEYANEAADSVKEIFEEMSMEIHRSPMKDPKYCEIMNIIPQEN